MHGQNHPQRRATDKEPQESQEFVRCPKYDQHELTDAQIDAIATQAAVKAVQLARDNFYKDVGRSVVSKWFILVGMATVALYAWGRKQGWL